MSSTHHIHGKITEVEASLLSGTHSPTFHIDTPADEGNEYNTAHVVWFPVMNDLPELAEKFHALANQFEDIHAEYMAIPLPQPTAITRDRLAEEWAEEEAERQACPENHGQGQGPCCPSPEEEPEEETEENADAIQAQQENSDLDVDLDRAEHYQEAADARREDIEGR